jgi:hypothetical protein
LRAIASPRPVPWCRPRGRRVDLRELAEDQLVVLGRDPIPCRHLDEQRLARPPGAAARTDTRPPPAAPVKWIALPSRLLSTCESFSRSAATGGRSGAGRRRAPRGASRERAVEREHLLDHRGERERRSRQRELVGRAARVGEDLAHHLEQVVAALDDPVDARRCRSLSGPSMPSRRISACVMIAVSGVRRSCETFERNCVLSGRAPAARR